MKTKYRYESVLFLFICFKFNHVQNLILNNFVAIIFILYILIKYIVEKLKVLLPTYVNKTK